MVDFGPVLLQYNFGKHVKAFSTCRQGGVSKGAYATFNANAYCGDEFAHVVRNRELLCNKLCLSQSRLIIPHQTHHDKVYKIDKNFLLKEKNVRQQILEGIDGVMTDIPKVCVCVSTADCIPLLLYDDENQAVAAVHAGWRGTVQKIVVNAIIQMGKAYGTNPDRLKAVIGPGISMDAFEVGDEVYDFFRSACFPLERIAARYPAMLGGTKWHIDLWEANRWLMQECGVKNENISLAGICTYKHNDRFFSARRAGINSGRILNGIMMTEECQ